MLIISICHSLYILLKVSLSHVIMFQFLCITMYIFFVCDQLFDCSLFASWVPWLWKLNFTISMIVKKAMKQNRKIAIPRLLRCVRKILKYNSFFYLCASDFFGATKATCWCFVALWEKTEFSALYRQVTYSFFLNCVFSSLSAHFDDCIGRQMIM